MKTGEFLEFGLQHNSIECKYKQYLHISICIENFEPLIWRWLLGEIKSAKYQQVKWRGYSANH